MANKKAAAKTPMSSKQAGAVANFLKGQKTAAPKAAPALAAKPVIDADADEE